MTTNDYKNKIISFYKDNKRMPVYTEIMKLVGFKSKNAVSKLVHKLIDEGVLDKDSSGHLIPNKLIGEIPMLGLVEAGFPLSCKRTAAKTILLSVAERLRHVGSATKYSNAILVCVKTSPSP